MKSSEEQTISVVNAIKKKKRVTLRSKLGLNFKKTQYLGQIRSVFAYVDTNQVVNLMLQAVN